MVISQNKITNFRLRWRLQSIAPLCSKNMKSATILISQMQKTRYLTKNFRETTIQPFGLTPRNRSLRTCNRHTDGTFLIETFFLTSMGFFSFPANFTVRNFTEIVSFETLIPRVNATGGFHPDGLVSSSVVNGLEACFFFFFTRKTETRKRSL